MKKLIVLLGLVLALSCNLLSGKVTTKHIPTNAVITKQLGNDFAEMELDGRLYVIWASGSGYMSITYIKDLEE